MSSAGGRLTPLGAGFPASSKSRGEANSKLLIKWQGGVFWAGGRRGRSKTGRSEGGPNWAWEVDRNSSREYNWLLLPKPWSPKQVSFAPDK